jgi:preprotein translocase subunit YajC
MPIVLIIFSLLLVVGVSVLAIKRDIKQFNEHKNKINSRNYNAPYKVESEDE